MRQYIILGCNGMLGRYMHRYLGQGDNVSTPVGRELIDAETATISTIRNILFDSYKPLFKKGMNYLPGNPVVVNCIGMIKPQVDKYGTEAAIRVNSTFPRLLSKVCNAEDVRYPLIHVTTDCVFSGNKGDYIETDPHDALDVYGKTKSLGEPEDCTVIRTSIIGEELNQSRSLMEWIKSNAGNTINGFTSHWWNGVTCLQLAKIVEKIGEEKSFWQGVRHIHSPNEVTKERLLDLVNEVYKLHIKVVPKAGGFCNRTLRTIHNTSIQIPELKQQIQEMKDFKL